MNRYDSYKDSGVEWIGEIPIGWYKSKIKYHFNLLSGFPFNSEEITNEEREFPIIRIGNVTSGKTDVYFDGELLEKHPKVENGEYIVSLTGDFSIRKWENQTSLLNQRCGLMKNISIDDVRYLFYFLPFHFRILEKTKYFTTLKNLSNGELLDLDFIFPPLTEQKQIVSFLDDKTEKIDTLIQQKEKKIELLKEKITSLINHVVTKGLDPNVEMKDSGVEWIGEIPKGWDFVKVGHYSNVVRGGSPRPSGDPRFFNGDFIHWITVKDITSKKGKYVTNTLSKLTKEGMKQSRVLEPETLVLTNSGVTLGVPGILKIQGCINDGSVGFLDLSEKLERDYLYYFWTTQTELLLEQQSGYGQPNLNIDIVSNVKFPLPSIKQQQQIVEYLDKQTEEIDTLIQLEQKKIDTLKEYRQSLISEVVTGKIRVCEEDTSLSLNSQTV